MDLTTDHYFEIYNQIGFGNKCVFRSVKHIQYGSGFGDMFRCVLRHMFPITPKPQPTAPEPAPKQVGEGRAKPKPKPKAKQPLYKQATQRARKRKITFQEFTAKVPNFHF